jgi:HK97 gp10 family phage protein
MATFKITGIKELDTALKQLEPKLQKKVLRQAMRESLKPVRSAVKAEAPVGETGDLAKSVKIKSGKRKKDTIRLNVQIGAGDFKGATYYAAFVEYGHHIGSRKLGDARTLQPANDYMKRAFDQTKEQARETARRLILAGIEREASKGASGH